MTDAAKKPTVKKAAGSKAKVVAAVPEHAEIQTSAQSFTEDTKVAGKKPVKKTATKKAAVKAVPAESVVETVGKTAVETVAETDTVIPAEIPAPSHLPSPEERYRMVQAEAYYIAERSGFSGSDTDHWAAAEIVIAKRLAV